MILSFLLSLAPQLLFMLQLGASDSASLSWPTKTSGAESANVPDQELLWMPSWHSLELTSCTMFAQPLDTQMLRDPGTPQMLRDAETPQILREAETPEMLKEAVTPQNAQATQSRICTCHGYALAAFAPLDTCVACCC